MDNQFLTSWVAKLLSLDRYYTGGSSGIATLQIHTPHPYTQGEDFKLRFQHFEVYSKAVGMPDEQLCYALLAHLDDAAFQAYDLMELPEETAADDKEPVVTLTERFSASTRLQEWQSHLSQRVQEADKSLDAFSDALIDLANLGYPNENPALRMELAKHRFMAGLWDDHLQAALSMQEVPYNLDEARKVAKRLEGNIGRSQE